MTPIRVPYDQMQFVWITDHYDFHLGGYCRHNGELAKFETSYPETYDEPLMCEVTPLTTWHQLKAKMHQKAFEVCVGTHWSYGNGKRGGYFKGFTPLTRLYFWIRKKR